MAKFTIQLVSCEGIEDRRFFRNNGWTELVDFPEPIEADCFFDAIVRMWRGRAEDGQAPRQMAFQPNHPENSDKIRMWMWSSRELIRIEKVG